MKNQNNVSLPLAVWLASDDYDYQNDPSVISTTSIMKPLKQLILTKRVAGLVELDVIDLVPSRMGTAIHDSIEKAWKNPTKALKKLGIKANVVVDPEEPVLDGISVFNEKRFYKTVGNYKISGKFDMVMDGVIMDFKSTSIRTYQTQDKLEDYRLQLSIYKWLVPELIKEEYGEIHYIFTDYQKKLADSTDYPKTRVLTQRIQLLTDAEVQRYIENKLRKIDQLIDSPESDMPNCTDKELWRSEPIYKYYADPSKTTGRSTKNFASQVEANSFCVFKGKGVVIPVLGEPVRCRYCPAETICNQAKEYYGI